MALKKHHKWIIGSFSSIIVIFMIFTTIFLTGLSAKQIANNNALKNEIEKLQADTQNKLNELTENFLETKSDLGIMDNKFELLKTSTSMDFSEIIENSIKSVVTIKTNIGQGTGFIITENGFIITNAHILAGGNIIESVNYEQEIIPTSFVGYDTEFDLALLKIEGTYNYLELANSNNALIGEKVIAIGNPLGLQFSVTEGIISGIHRLGPNNLETYIQTDAALNPGNSGGPLINKQGKVVGINNFKLDNGESLGFALESNYIKETANQITQEVLKISILS